MLCNEEIPDIYFENQLRAYLLDSKTINEKEAQKYIGVDENKWNKLLKNDNFKLLADGILSK